jgi:hypothetical protein
MKRVLQLLTAFALTLGIISLSQPVLADAHDEPTDRKVVVHYHRWDGEYDGTHIHTWGVGTDGVGGDIALSGTDDFGGYYEIFIDEDSDATLGLILKYGAGWGDGKNDRDGLIPENNGDKANKSIVVKVDGEFVGFDEDGVKHVFVYEGMNEVIYQDPNHGPMRDGFGTLAVVYYDPAEDYDGWNVWAFRTGTGGSVHTETGVPFVASLDVDGGRVGQEMYRIAFFSIADDAEDTMGFIVRTDSWDKQFADDLFIDVTDIKGDGYKTVFYIGLSDVFYDTFEEFDAVANAFDVETGELQDLRSLLIEFNKPVNVATEVDGTLVYNFDEAWFTVVDDDGEEVPFNNIAFTRGTASTAEFMIIFEEDLEKGVTYTMTYQKSEEEIPAVFDFSVPNTAPTITIIGSRNVTLELGDRYSLPTFRATESFYGENLPIYTARVKEDHGYLSTRETGTYELVLTATDRFGNVAEETITVNVVDPCVDETTASQAAPIVLLAGLPLLAGAWFVLRRKEDK